MRKRYMLAVIMLALLLVGSTLSCAAPATTPRPMERLLMGTTVAGSSWYAYCVADAAVLNKYVPGLEVTVVETRATWENMERTYKGELDFADVSTFDALVNAYYRTGKWKEVATEPFSKLRVYQVVTLLPWHLTARVDSGIKSLKDLQGKRFNCGATGGSLYEHWMAIFESLGIEIDYFHGSSVAAADAMKDNRIPSFVRPGAGLCALDAATLQVLASTPLRIISLTEEEVEKAMKVRPGLSRVDIPAGCIESLGDHPPIITLGYTLSGFVTTDFSEDLVYDMIKAIHTHWDEIAPSVASLAETDIINLTIKTCSEGVKPLPLHAGVVRYFKELGMEVPASIIPPEYKG